MNRFLPIIMGMTIGMGTWSVPVQAGFEWADSPPATVVPVAPVDTVDRAVLPPQTGVKTSEKTLPMAGMGGASAPARTPAPAVAPPSYTPHQPRPSAAPMARGAGAGGSPFPPTGAVYPPPYQGPAPVASGAPVNIQPVVAAPAVTTPVQVAPTLPPRRTDLVVVDGFGNGVPLSLAMTQIVPPDFQVVYQSQPNPGLVVSWSGGRRFDKILEDMLFAHGYRVYVTGQQVIIHAAGVMPQIVGSGMAIPMPRGMVARPQPQPVAVVPAPVPVASIPVPQPVEPIPAAPIPSPAGVVYSPVVPAANPMPTFMPAAPTATNVSAPSATVTSVGFQSEAIDIYSGRVGESLDVVLTRWARIAGVQIDWQYPSGHDLSLPQSFAINSTLPRALERILDLYQNASPRPVATLSGAGPQARILIEASGDSTGFSYR